MTKYDPRMAVVTQPSQTCDLTDRLEEPVSPWLIPRGGGILSVTSQEGLPFWTQLAQDFW